jgi:hypothetical protein
LSEGLQLESLAIIDALGKSRDLHFVSENDKEYQVQINDLENGLYWLSIQTNQGKVFKQMELLP